MKKYIHEITNGYAECRIYLYKLVLQIPCNPHHSACGAETKNELILNVFMVVGVQLNITDWLRGVV